MSLPKDYRPREGDVVVLHGTVKYDFDPTDDDEAKIFVRLIEDYADRRVPLSTVVGLFSRAWKAGDAVRNVDDHEDAGTVVATYGTYVWVKPHSGAPLVTFDNASLEDDPAAAGAENYGTGPAMAAVKEQDRDNVEKGFMPAAVDSDDGPLAKEEIVF